MKIGIANESWRPEIKGRRERPRRAILYLKERGEKLLILAATFSLEINLLTRYYPELNTLALLLSVITFLSSIVVVTRVQILKAETATIEVNTPSPSLIQSCPKCGEELGENPDLCSNCGWKADDD